MKCVRFAKIINNTTITNIFNIDNSDITKTKTQHYQITTVISNKILIFKPLIKKPIATNRALFTVINFSDISIYCYQFLAILNYEN